MIDEKKLIKVTNRDDGHVGYKIPDLNNLVRDFNANETKVITFEELRKLSYIPGGPTLIRDYLVIDDEEAIKEILGTVEPEYYYTEENIKELFLTGSVDALKDCLEFAPKGIIDLIKKLAVEMPLNDVEKRKAILEITGFNVDSAIAINEETSEEKEDTQKVRRLNNSSSEKSTSRERRTSVPGVSNVKYITTE